MGTSILPTVSLVAKVPNLILSLLPLKHGDFPITAITGSPFDINTDSSFGPKDIKFLQSLPLQ